MNSRGEIFVASMQALAILFAGVAALAATWQGFVTWQSASTHYADNLQARQIDSCTEFLFRARAAIKSFKEWTELKTGHISGPFDVDLFRSAAQADVGQVGAPLVKMQLLSGPEASQTLDRMSSANNSMGLLLAANSISGATESHLHQYDKDLEYMTKRCGDIMLGHRVGLI